MALARFAAGLTLLAAASNPACAVEFAAGGESVLLQTTELKMQARAAQRLPPRMQLVQADAQIASFLQSRRADPQQIAASVQRGLAAVMTAVKHFMMEPPQVEQGLDAMGRELLEALAEPIRKQYSDVAAYQAFEEEWMKFFDNAASTAPFVQGNITLFQQEGRPEGVVMAVSEILATLGDGVARFVPHETAQEVVRYVDMVSDLLGAVGSSWSGFESGQEAQAIEDLYFALRSVLDAALPEDLRNDETFSMVIGTLDAVIFGLSETVLDFQRQIVEGAVCWKVQEARKKKRPSVCPEGFYWNGEAFCLPKPSQETAVMLQAAAASLEVTAARKQQPGTTTDGAAGGKTPLPDGAMVAVCEETGNYTEKNGHWCHAACPAGMVSTGLQCKTACQGEFPADDGAMMCGENPGVIAEAIMNMVIGVTNGAISSGVLIAAMAKDGVDTDSLANTIQAFVNMGKPFAYKTCPLPGRE